MDDTTRAALGKRAREMLAKAAAFKLLDVPLGLGRRVGDQLQARGLAESVRRGPLTLWSLTDAGRDLARDLRDGRTR
jgi:hypothetical protein